jgi:hypothetical protein
MGLIVDSCEAAGEKARLGAYNLSVIAVQSRGPVNTVVACPRISYMTAV